MKMKAIVVCNDDPNPKRKKQRKKEIVEEGEKERKAI